MKERKRGVGVGGRERKSEEKRLAIILHGKNGYKISAPHKLFAGMSILE